MLFMELPSDGRVIIESLEKVRRDETTGSIYHFLASKAGVGVLAESMAMYLTNAVYAFLRDYDTARLYLGAFGTRWIDALFEAQDPQLVAKAKQSLYWVYHFDEGDEQRFRILYLCQHVDQGVSESLVDVCVQLVQEGPADSIEVLEQLGYTGEQLWSLYTEVCQGDLAFLYEEAKRRIHQ